MAGWTPSEFWSATLGEVVIAVKAYRQRVEHQHQLAAWHVAHVINLVAKTPVTPAKLLGKKSKEPRVFTPQMYGGNIELMKAAIARAVEEDAMASEEDYDG